MEFCEATGVQSLFFMHLFYLKGYISRQRLSLYLSVLNNEYVALH